MAQTERLFTDSWKRFDRAIEHAKALEVQWTALVDPEAYQIVIEMNGDWTRGIARVVTSKPRPKNDLALELGEMFYQLRAALDAAIYQTAILSGGFADATDEGRVEFPICPVPDNFKRNPINKAPFPKELRDWLESIQPYNVAKASDPAFVRGLQLLHDCARKDRHRRLHVVVAIPADTRLEFSVTPPGRITAVQPLAANFLENETEFLAFQMEGATPETNITIKLNTNALIEVAIEDIPSVSSKELGKKFNWLFHYTKAAIEHLEAFF